MESKMPRPRSSPTRNLPNEANGGRWTHLIPKKHTTFEKYSTAISPPKLLPKQPFDGFLEEIGVAQPTQAAGPSAYTLQHTKTNDD
jgi:hypothetical protein